MLTANLRISLFFLFLFIFSAHNLKLDPTAYKPTKVEKQVPANVVVGAAVPPQTLSKSSTHDLAMRLNQSNNANVQWIKNGNNMTAAVNDNYNQKNQPLIEYERDNHYSKIQFPTTIDAKNDSIAHIKQSNVNKSSTNLDNNKLGANDCKYENNNINNNDSGYTMTKYNHQHPHHTITDINNFNQMIPSSNGQRSLVYASITDLSQKQNSRTNQTQRQSQLFFESNHVQQQQQPYDLSTSKTTAFAHQSHNEWTQRNSIQLNDEVVLLFTSLSLSLFLRTRVLSI